MSGKAWKQGNFGWEFEAKIKTIAQDAIDKMKHCSFFTEKERKEENLLVGNYIFAISSNHTTGKNVKSLNPDAKGIFKQLPKDVKEILNYHNNSFQRRVKNKISTKNGDQIADIDGDGKVDLIFFDPICSDDPNSEGDHCGFIFMKINSKWKEVGATNKA